jgi:hypothetical protein
VSTRRESMPNLRTVAALVAAIAAAAAALSPGSRAGVPRPWRLAHANAIRTAILEDVLLEAEGVAGRPEMTVCVGLRRGDSAHSAGVELEPPPELLGGLVLGAHPIVALSKCGMLQWMLVDSEGRPAVLVEVGEIEWVSADFVRARARWHRGVLSDAAYVYTVSRIGRRWRVDTAMLKSFA